MPNLFSVLRLLGAFVRLRDPRKIQSSRGETSGNVFQFAAVVITCGIILRLCRLLRYCTQVGVQVGLDELEDPFQSRFFSVFCTHRVW